VNQLTAQISILHLEDSDLDSDLINANLRRGGIVHTRRIGFGRARISSRG
jgi:hypothetical protein